MNHKQVEVIFYRLFSSNQLRKMSDLCKHEQVTLKPMSQVDDSLTTLLQIWYLLSPPSLTKQVFAAFH